MAEEIMGTTEMALKALADSRRLYERNKAIGVAQLFGIKPMTFYDWMLGKTYSPEGLNLLKARLSLSLLGFRLLEREMLQHGILELADQLALSLYKIEEVAKIIGVDYRTVSTWFKGRCPVKGERYTIITEQCKQFRPEALQRMIHLRKMMDPYKFFPVILPPYFPVRDRYWGEEKRKESHAKARLLSAFAHQVHATIELGQEITERALPGDIQSLNKSTRRGQVNGMLVLKDILSKFLNWSPD